MRKFSVRWWVVDPLASYKRALADLRGDAAGLSVRFRREATEEDVRYFVHAWFPSLETGEFTVQ